MSKNTLLSELINYISANSSGNVVIAAPSSGYALDVTGTGRFTSSITGVNATFAGTPSNTVQAAGSPFLYLNGGTGTSYTTLQQGVGKFDIYQFNGSAFVNTFTITSAGNVGIGISTPISGGSGARWITTDGSGSTYGGGLISSLNGNAKAYYYYDGTYAQVQGASGVGIQFTTNGATTAATITSAGNLLIGKTSDNGYPLQVNGTISVTGTYGLSKASTGAFLPMYINGTLYYLLIYA